MLAFLAGSVFDNALRLAVSEKLSSLTSLQETIRLFALVSTGEFERDLVHGSRFSNRHRSFVTPIVWIHWLEFG